MPKWTEPFGSRSTLLSIRGTQILNVRWWVVLPECTSFEASASIQTDSGFIQKMPQSFDTVKWEWKLFEEKWLPDVPPGERNCKKRLSDLLQNCTGVFALTRTGVRCICCYMPGIPSPPWVSWKTDDIIASQETLCNCIIAACFWGVWVSFVPH